MWPMEAASAFWYFFLSQNCVNETWMQKLVECAGEDRCVHKGDATRGARAVGWQCG